MGLCERIGIERRIERGQGGVGWVGDDVCRGRESGRREERMGRRKMGERRELARE